MKVLALIENTPASGSAVDGEHGLSLLINAEGRRVLFDTGASGLVVRNANRMGFGEALSHLDAIVLSHGHYDHTGGLAEILRRMRATVRVFVRPGFFGHRVHRSERGERDIGVPATRREFESLGARFVESRGRAEVVPGLLYVTGEIALREAWEDTEPSLCVERNDGALMRDPFLEEQAVAARTHDGIVVFIGCAHRGLINSIGAAQEAANDTRVRAVFGGAHLRSATSERIERTVEAVEQLGPELVALGHCTGAEAEERFANALGARFRPLRAGSAFDLDMATAHLGAGEARSP